MIVKQIWLFIGVSALDRFDRLFSMINFYLFFNFNLLSKYFFTLATNQNILCVEIWIIIQKKYSTHNYIYETEKKRLNIMK